MAITVTVNGTPHSLDVEAEMPLLWALRETLGLTGTKFGCGIAACGACTVHLEGRAVRSCVLLDKAVKRAVEIKADFKAFDCPNVFVVGYGMDAGHRFRELPFVGRLLPIA